MYTHVTALIDLLRDGNFQEQSCTESTVSGVAERLHALSDHRTINHQSYKLKIRSAAPRQDGGIKHRLGSEKSLVGKKQKQQCGFCKQTGRHPGNAANCDVKQRWGECYSRKQKTTDIESLLEKIVEGTTGYPNVSGWSIVQGKELLSRVPVGSKRIQIKGYTKGTDNIWYLLCTCIDSMGVTLSKYEGSKYKSYQDVLIRKTAVNTALMSCDYIFFSAAKNTPDFETNNGGGEGAGGGAGGGAGEGTLI